MSEKIQKICRDKNCVLLDENTVLPITKKDINYKVGKSDRSGWLFQQLLKWGADCFTENENFLVTEADTVFCRPRVFFFNNKYRFPVSSYPCHVPYFLAIQRLIGLKIKPINNLTSHHALYNKTFLKALKKEIEEKADGKPWYQAIIDKIDRSEGSAVSDYESYGQYVVSEHRDNVELEYWYNIHFGRSELGNLKKIGEELGQSYKAISFHAYDE